MEILADRTIIPTEGGWLCNTSQKIMSVDNKVFLGIEDDGSEWSEITMERKAELETLWETEDNPENMATDEDYISVLEDLGVDFGG